MLSITDTWIKAAVEHRVLNMDYFSRRTKHEDTNRDIEPDFVGPSRDGKNNGLWATYCHLRKKGPRSFRVDSIRNLRVTSKEFSPSTKGRWKELIPLYKKKGLDKLTFEGEQK